MLFCPFGQSFSTCGIKNKLFYKWIKLFYMWYRGLAVLHYPGTLEQFLARKGDSRNFTEKEYRERHGPDAGKGGRADLFYTDIATGWLPHFVERVGGLDVAKYLLQGAGQVDHSSQLWTRHSPTNWKEYGRSEWFLTTIVKIMVMFCYSKKV